MFLAPRWAFSAQALDAATDPRLARGVHIRAMPSGRLGLPLTPLVVYRIVMAQPDDKLLRHDIRWVDRNGATLTGNVDVKPDNPVTGWLPPPPSACCWLEVQAKPNAGGLEVDAMVSTRRGPAAVAVKRATPYIVAASSIEHVVVRGSGTITGVRWVDAASLVADAPWRQWSMPITAGPRYAAATGPTADGKARAFAGAPRLRGLYEDPSVASGPAAAAPVIPDDEWARLDPLRVQLGRWLDKLTHDTSVPADQLTQAFSIDAGSSTGTGALPILPSALQAILDPGLARWAGFADVDASALPSGAIVLYLIAGVWQLTDRLVPPALVGQLPPGAVFDGAKTDPTKRLPLIDVKNPLGLKVPCVELWTVAAATVGAPWDPPLPPAIALGNGPWMPSPPSAPIRQIEIDASSLTAAAVVALARKDASGGAIEGLNPKSPTTGQVLPLFAAPANAARETGRARFEDRHAPPAPPTYRLAQADWFGRWSNWQFATAATKPRTPPPKPSLEVFYEPAPATGTGGAAGKLTLRAAIPDDAAMPPGAEPLRFLELSLQALDVGYALGGTYPVGGGLPFVHVVPATAPVAPATTPAPTPAILEIVLDGPALAIGATTKVAITARWLTDATASAPSDPIRRDVSDVRPVPPPAIDPALRYTAKPDARGRAHFELALPALANARYRVFYADENQLLTGVRKLAAGGFTVDGTPAQVAAIRARAAIAAIDLAAALAQGAADRATQFLRYADLYLWDMFQNLTPTAFPPPPPAAGAGDPPVVRHDLSGALTALSFYRVITFNAAGVPSDFASSPLVPVAVRSEPPPARPMISVTGAVTGTPAEPVFGARITVRVPRTQIDPVAYRVRRASVSGSPDPRQMMVVFEGALPADRDAGRELVTFVHDEPGPLAPWRRYAWSVEVRAGAPAGAAAGSTLIGDYGPPATPTTFATIPPGPPPPITTLTATRAADGVHLAWTAPNPVRLIASDMGSHRFDLYRVVPNQHPQRLAVPSPPVLDPDGVFRFIDAGAPSAAGYRIVVVDPLGRGSRPSLTVTPS